MYVKENEHVNGAPPVYRPLASASLVDGRDGLDHALHRRCHGHLIGKLPPPGVDPSPAGYCHSDPGRHTLREPAIELLAAVSGHDVARRAPRGNGVRVRAVWLHVRSTAGWLGNAVCSALSDRPLWLCASTFYPSARSHAVCGITESPHHHRLPFFPNVPCSFGSDFISHADREGRNLKADGAMEHWPTK